MYLWKSNDQDWQAWLSCTLEQMMNLWSGKDFMIVCRTAQMIAIAGPSFIRIKVALTWMFEHYWIQDQMAIPNALGSGQAQEVSQLVKAGRTYRTDRPKISARWHCFLTRSYLKAACCSHQERNNSADTLALAQHRWYQICSHDKSRLPVTLHCSSNNHLQGYNCTLFAKRNSGDRKGTLKFEHCYHTMLCRRQTRLTRLSWPSWPTWPSRQTIRQVYILRWIGMPSAFWTL